jgi:hypothetical protein
LTLSIHEALTFDGVELALHPDVFQTNKDDGEQQQKTQGRNNYSRGLQPGDLVEIRVWSVRPGVTIDNQNTTTAAGSAIKSNVVGGSNYHSRNPSLVTLSSASILSPGNVPVKNTNYHSRNPSTLSSASILSPGNIPVNTRNSGVYGGGSTSLANTPQSTENSVSVMNAPPLPPLPPPLPSIIGGAGPSPTARGASNFQYDNKDKGTPELHGEFLIEGGEAKNNTTPSTSNLSSTALTSLVGSTLPLHSLPNMPLFSQKNKLSFSTIETDSMQGHSRDSSLVTSASAMHVSCCLRLVD